MNLIRLRVSSLVALIYLTFPGALTLAAPADVRLLELVGDDAGAVIEINDLRTHRTSIVGCEVLTRLQDTSLFGRWKKGKDFQKLIVARNVIEQLVGKPLGEFVDNIFGRSVVIAVYPEDAEKSDVVLMTQAVNAAALQEALQAWNRAERAELSEIAFGGTSYIRRGRRRDDKKSLPPQFYFQSDNVLAFSNSEGEIRRVISLHTNSSRSSFPNTIAFQESHKLPAKRFAALYLNPRAWDQQVIHDADNSKGSRYLKQLWLQCDSIAFGLAIDKQGVVVNGTAHLREPARNAADESPAQGDDIAGGNTSRPVFLSRVPRRAVALFVGEHDLVNFARLILGWIPEKDQEDWVRIRSLGRGLLIGFDLFDDVLPALKKNWGAYVVASQETRPGHSPFDAVVGVELPPPGKVARGKITLRDALDNALQTTLRIVAASPAAEDVDRNAEIITTLHSRGVDILSVDAGNSIRPAFALTEDHLIAGTSPVALQEFVELRRDKALDTDPGFRAMADRRFADGQQLAYINSAALRQVIAANESLFSSRLADSKTKGGSLQRIRGLRDLLKSFDAVFLASRTSARRLIFSAGIVVSPSTTD